jgi:hypothetical protein
MTKLQSPLDVPMAMLRNLEEFKRSGSKEPFRKQLREGFVRRLGAASLDEALVMALASLIPLLPKSIETISRKRGDSRPSLVNRTGNRSGSQQALDGDQGGNESGCGMFGSVR